MAYPSSEAIGDVQLGFKMSVVFRAVAQYTEKPNTQEIVFINVNFNHLAKLGVSSTQALKGFVKSLPT